MKFQKLKATLKVRLISILLQGIVVSSTLPFIALYLSERIGNTNTGLFLTFVVMINMFFSLLGGKIGNPPNKKKYIVISQFLMSLFLFFMGYNLTNDNSSIYLFCLLYILFNISYGIQRPIMDASLMDAIEDNEKYVYKINYWFFNISVAVGSILGTVFYNKFSNYLFTLGGLVLFIISLLLIKFFYNIENHTIQKNNSPSYKSYIRCLKNKKFILLMCGYNLLLFGEFSLASYIAIRLKDTVHEFFLLNYEINGANIFGFLMFLNTFTIITLTLLINKGASAFSNKSVLLAGVFLYSIGYIVLSISTSVSILIIFIIVASIGEILYAPIYNSEKFKIIPDNERGVYSAISLIFLYISEVLSRLLIVSSDYLNFTQITMIYGIMLLIGSLIVYIVLFKYNRA